VCVNQRLADFKSQRSNVADPCACKSRECETIICEGVCVLYTCTCVRVLACLLQKRRG
jgi:hypothetical protein